MGNKKIGVVIVAGGMSSRMKEFKPLLQVGKKTMIQRTIDNYKQIGADEIVLVTGHRSEDIEEVLKNQKIKIVKNKDYQTTHMYDSVCIGLKELSDAIDYTFISPADSPFVQQFTLEKMIQEIKVCQYELLQPVYKEDGHPLLIKKAFFKRIEDHDGTMGIRGVIQKNQERCGKLSFVDPGIIMDADTPSDYFKLLAFNKDKDIPNAEVCGEIQKYFAMEEKVLLHSQKVTLVALDMYEKLKIKGLKLNIKLLIAAGLLHDIGKGQAKHEKVGADWLKSMGYEAVSQIVMEHMELKEIPETLTEKELIFLADKLVREDQIVSIEERFEDKERAYKDNKPALAAVRRRKKQAQTIQATYLGL